MKPQVFEDEVYMKMKISSTSLDTSTGKLTPSFNQREMSSVARIKDGKPTLIAGVSQTNQSKETKGIPILGLIPILGRFFATPDTIDRQSDVVITVTPHILRRADITDKDHLTRAAGYSADPATQLSIQQIIELAEIDDQQQQNQLASATTSEAPKPPAPENRNAAAIPSAGSQRPEVPGVVVIQPTLNQINPAAQPLKPVRSEITKETVAKPGEVKKPVLDDDDDDDDDDTQVSPNANANHLPVMVSVKSASAVAVKGQDLYVAVIVNGNGEMSSSNVSLSFDPNILEVKGVREGGALSSGGGRPNLQFSSEGGQLNVQLELPSGTPGRPARGQLLLIVFTVKNQGQTPLTLNEGQTMLRSASGQMLPLKLQSTQIEVR
jgi:general secretion pathway protein D